MAAHRREIFGRATIVRSAEADVSTQVKRIKLLLVSPCQGSYGGIEAFVLAVAGAVREEPDFQVRVCFKKTVNFALQPAFAEMLRHEPVTFCDRGGRELSDAIAWADVVHLQNASPDVVAFAKLKRKRLVLTIHNYMRREWSLHRVLWRIAARFADARWYNSQFVWDTWEPHKKGAGSRKIPTTSKLPEGWTPPADRKGLVFVGRWIPNKGIDVLVDAYARAAIDREKWPLMLIGDGPLRAAIESQIAANQVSGIQMLGFVDEATKKHRVQNARWAVVPPNTNEDFGLTAIEARNLGVPCIITRDGGLPEAGGKQALVCEPGDIAGLASLLERAAAMSEEEYAERAERTRAELADELMPISFYADAYRRIMRGEPVASRE
jgi:glycosyltransferase involved in cell wall biosynthesis